MVLPMGSVGRGVRFVDELRCLSILVDYQRAAYDRASADAALRRDAARAPSATTGGSPQRPIFTGGAALTLLQTMMRPR